MKMICLNLEDAKDNQKELLSKGQFFNIHRESDTRKQYYLLPTCPKGYVEGFPPLRIKV